MKKIECTWYINNETLKEVIFDKVLFLQGDIGAKLVLKIDYLGTNDMLAYAVFKKPDGTLYSQNLFTQTGNIFTFDLIQECLNEVGFYEIQVTIKSQDGKVTIPKLIKYEVKKILEFEETCKVPSSNVVYVTDLLEELGKAIKDNETLVADSLEVNKKLELTISNANVKDLTLKETILNAENRNNILVENTKIANTSNYILVENTIKANASNSNLKLTTDNAIIVDDKLKSTIIEAKKVNENLLLDTSNASDVSKVLVENLDKATLKIAEVKKTTENANSSNVTLKESIVLAESKKQELSDIVVSGVTTLNQVGLDVQESLEGLLEGYLVFNSVYNEDNLDTLISNETLEVGGTHKFGEMQDLESRIYRLERLLEGAK